MDFSSFSFLSGAVYYYRNGGGDVGLVPDSDRVRITGKSESRFGFSLANAGDLNRDGREDLLVGAPYDDRGKVFVFMGGENGIGTKPSQVRTDYISIY
jgi:syndecan 4